MIRLLTPLLLLSSATALSGLLSPGDRRMSRREERIARDERREQVRSALRAAEGYWFFENVTTDEAGAIDFLGAGPAGLYVVIVRDDSGYVTAIPPRSLLHEGRPFGDDPRVQEREAIEDVLAKLEADDRDETVYSVICFTRAEMYYLGGEDRTATEDLCNVWGLASFISGAPQALSPERVEDLARWVERAYDRPPIITPEDYDL